MRTRTLEELLRRCVTMPVLAAGLALAATATARAADGTVTIWVGSWWDPQIPVLQQLWQPDHPALQLNVQPLPINGYLDKFTAAALGGTPPDIIDLDSTWVSTVAAQGLLQPLDDVAARLNVPDISPAAWGRAAIATCNTPSRPAADPRSGITTRRSSTRRGCPTRRRIGPMTTSSASPRP